MFLTVQQNMSENTVKRHYFEPGAGIHTIAPGQESRLPQLLRTTEYPGGRQGQLGGT